MYAAGVGLHASPGEDLSAPEAHALLLTRSIVDDGNLDLSDEYGAAAWRPFYGGTLVPLTGPRERGQLEPIAVGFPLLCAPAYALGGRLAVELWLAALSALGFVAAGWIARRVVPDPWATRGVLAVGLSPPAVVAATTIAPDAVAGSRAGRRRRARTRGARAPLGAADGVGGHAAGHAAVAGRALPGARGRGDGRRVPLAAPAPARPRRARRRRGRPVLDRALRLDQRPPLRGPDPIRRAARGREPDRRPRARRPPRALAAAGVAVGRAPRGTAAVGARVRAGLRGPWAARALAPRAPRAGARRAGRRRGHRRVPAHDLRAAVLVAAFLAPTIAGPWFAGHTLVAALPASARWWRGAGGASRARAARWRR